MCRKWSVLGVYTLILLSFFVGESVSSQILKNNILPDVTGWVTSIYHIGARVKMIFGLRGNVNMRLSYDYGGMSVV